METIIKTCPICKTEMLMEQQTVAVGQCDHCHGVYYFESRPGGDRWFLEGAEENELITPSNIEKYRFLMLG